VFVETVSYVFTRAVKAFNTLMHCIF